MPKILQRLFSGLCVFVVIACATVVALQTPTQVLALVQLPHLQQAPVFSGKTGQQQKDQELMARDGISSIGSTVGCPSCMVDSMTAKFSLMMLGGDLEGVDSNGVAIRSRGIAPELGSYIAYMYDAPPATTQKYVADLLKSAGVGLAQPAYAQGLGFASLDPILESWKTFRNVAYLFFVIIFLVIGFMIMFRRKIGGQTVVTAQQAIPSIIMALLTVTFSFAIAGLLIDGMYFIMFMMLSVFGKVEMEGASNLVTMNFLELGFVLVKDTTGSASEAVSTFVEAATSSFGGGLSEALAGLSGTLMIFIVGVAIVISMFRLFFELLKTYIAIIVSIVLSPILLMFGAIPGKSPFEGWLKGLIGNLAAFPIVLMIIIIFDELTGAVSQGGTGILGLNPAGASSAGSDPVGGFLPPYLIGQGNAQAISFLIGFGMILIMPDLVKEGKKMFGATGGVFEQFGNALQDSLKKGWTGDHDLIPGVAATNLAKSPLTRWMGGISGQNIPRKIVSLGAGAVGGAVGYPEGAIKRRFTGRKSITGYERMQERSSSFANTVGDFLGDQQLNNKGKDTKKSGH